MRPRFKIAATVLIALGVPLAFSQDLPRRGWGEDRIAAVLEPIRIKYRLPALAGAIVTGDGLVAAGAVGVRKAGTGVAVTINDLWHLGSDTKAMTATLIGVLVEQGKLDWMTMLEQVFPDLAPELPPEMRRLTLRHLLSHRAGLPANLPWYDLAKSGRSLREQRLETVKMLAKVKLLSGPGSTYLYSNLGYVVAGAMVEQTVSVTHSGSNTMNYAVVWMNLPAAQRTPDVVVDGRSDALRIETPDGLWPR